jgi:hypothetical protein
MKENELRIGNWINVGGELNQFTIADFCDIFDNGNKWFKDLFKPIQLTEEWLLKFGFELYDYEPSEEEDDFIFKDYKKSLDGKTFYYTICECPYNEWDFGIKLTWAEQALLSRIKYVHQLQNLYFALTGEELEIK